MVNEKKHLPPKCVIPGTNIPKQSLPLGPMKICKFILGFLSRNLFEVQLSWLPIICGKKYKQFMSVLLKNHNFTTRFSVSVLSFFNRNSRFTLIYIKNFEICVISTEKLSTLLICGKQSLKLMFDPLKICEFTTRFSE